MNTIPCQGGHVVSDTLPAPWSANGRIWINKANGNRAPGSGTVIGPRHVLTAAHVVYDLGPDDELRFYPALDGDTAHPPFPPIRGSRFELCMWEYPSSKADVALLILDHPLPTGVARLEMTEMAENQAVSVCVHEAGFPLGHDDAMWHTQGRIASIADGVFRVPFQYNNLDSGGASGSGVWIDGQPPRLVGVHSKGPQPGGPPGHRCALLTAEIIGEIRQWVADNP